jgi:hypothetical protein
MLQPVSHYSPWDADDVAYCGRRMTATTPHSLAPTCPVCAARLDAEAGVWDETPLPLDADEAQIDLDPMLNAGVPSRSPLADELFHMARVLNACYALTLVEKRGRR